MAAAKTEDVKLTSIRYPGEDLGIWTVLRVFFIITGLVLLLTGVANGSVGAIVLSIFMLVLLLPYTNLKFKEKAGFGVTRGLKIIALVVLLAAQGTMMETKGIGGSKSSTSQTSISTSNNGPDKILKSDLELLPVGSELPTEYSRGGQPNNVTLEEPGFVSGATFGAEKVEGSAGAVTLDFRVYRFNTPSNATSYYDRTVKRIEDSGGYTELSISTNAKCFSFKEDYGFQQRIGTSICLRKNIVFETEVNAVNTYKTVDSITKDMAKLFDGKVN